MGPRIASSCTFVISLHTTTILSPPSSWMSLRVSAILLGDSKSTTAYGPDKYLPEYPFLLALLQGKETVEKESIGRQARYGEGGYGRGRSWDRPYLNTGFITFSHNHVSRVGNAGGACGGNKGGALPSRKLFCHGFGATLLAERIDRGDRFSDVEVAQELESPFPVFRDDEIDFSEDLHGPKCDVLKISYGCADNIQGILHDACLLP